MVGFLVEGAAKGAEYTIHVVVPAGMAEVVREDLRQLRASEGLDWQVWAPPARRSRKQDLSDITPSHGDVEALADFANRHVPVDAWVVTFPHFAGSLRLAKPKATLFPDALPYDFPLGWLDDTSWNKHGSWPSWRRTAQEVMASSTSVITFSEHVASRHLSALFDLPPEKIRVVALAPPDLMPLLPWLSDRRQTPESRAIAGAILRSHATRRDLKYLQTFPFEEVEFLASATQDRPTKNLGLTAEAVRKIVQDQRKNMKLFVTAAFQSGADWTRLPDIVATNQLQFDVLSMPDLSREVHAAFLHCASIVVHSSLFEGITGALPLFEATSVGTPCLIADGPHIQELLAQAPGMEPFVFDPYDTDRLIELISDVAGNRDAVVADQIRALETVRNRCWADVVADYAQAALEGTATH